jgi:acetate kinase
MNILVLNCGSSSAKFAVIHPTSGREFISGIAQRLGSPEASLDWKRDGQKGSKALPGAEHGAALRAVVALLEAEGLASDLGGIGHRVVHGGAKFAGSMPLTAEVIHKVEECIPLGPLHNPPNLVGIRIAQELFPKLPQVGVFDTAFHQTMPPVAYLYPVPYAWYEQHQVRRYGFHGTSHRFVAQHAVKEYDLPAKHGIITAHLGNGCSCAAVKDGKSVDTTMGLTPLEGLVMGTRSGDVDPGLHAYLAREAGLSLDEIDTVLNKRSGLLGLSGVNDFRELEQRLAAADTDARLAFDVAVHRLKHYVGAYLAVLGGLDVLVFTAGVGENSVSLRAAVTEGLDELGITVDRARNAARSEEARVISPDGSRVVVAVVPTNEELAIARQTATLVG